MLQHLCKTLFLQERVEIEILSLIHEHTFDDITGWEPLKPRVFPIKYKNLYRYTKFGYSPEMCSWARNSEFDIVHTHGLWMYPSVVSLLLSMHNKRPYIMSVHGMLDPWALKNSRLAKKVLGALYENKHLKKATCVHALCEPEKQAIRKYGLTNPICTIPNGVSIPDNKAISLPPWQEQTVNGRKVLLFLGRIHPKKGLVNLINAWSLLLRQSSREAKEWILAIAGWDQLDHEAVIKRLVKDLEVDNSVLFLGPQFGEKKLAAYRNANAFILPSLSEGLPMTVLEAWANGLPVLMTKECNLPEGFCANAAIQIGTDIAGIGSGLQQLVSMHEDELCHLKENALRLVKENFSWQRIASDMKSVYEWMLGGGPVPSCVRTD